MKPYETLYKLYKKQTPNTPLAHFYPINTNNKKPFKLITEQTYKKINTYNYTQQKYQNKYKNKHT